VFEGKRAHLNYHYVVHWRRGGRKGANALEEQIFSTKKKPVMSYQGGRVMEMEQRDGSEGLLKGGGVDAIRWHEPERIMSRGKNGRHVGKKRFNKKTGPIYELVRASTETMEGDLKKKSLLLPKKKRNEKKGVSIKYEKRGKDGTKTRGGRSPLRGTQQDTKTRFLYLERHGEKVEARSERKAGWNYLQTME